MSSHRAGGARPSRPEAQAGSGPVSGDAALESRLRETAALLSVARVASATTDFREALRLICRELAQLTGGESVAAYVGQPAGAELSPMAAYHVPKHALEALAGAKLTAGDQHGFDAVFRSGQVIWSDDLPSDPRFAIDLVRRFPHQSGLIIPLSLDDQVAGAFYLVWWHPRRRFEDADLAPLQAIGAQAGVLLRNARLHEALNARAGRLRTLTRLNQLVSSSLEPDEVLAGIAAAAAELMQVAVVSVWVVDAVLKRLDARAFAGPAGVPDFPRRWFEAGEGDVGWVATQRRVLEIDDVATDERVTNREWWDAYGFRSFLGVPIIFQDLLLGVLVMGGREPFRFAADDHETLDVFVTQSASAIAKARLFQDIQDRRRLTEDLYALTQAMDRSMDLQERVEIFAASALRALNFERLNVWLAEPDGATLRLVAGSDARPEVAPLLPLGQVGGFREVWGSGIPLMVADNEQLAHVPPLPPEWRHHPILRTRRFAVVPLLVQGRPVGMVSVDNKPSRRPITRRAVAHLELFCQQLATSVNNASLYGETRQRERDATLLLEVTRKLSSTLELDAVLGLVADGTIEALGCASAGFYRWDAYRGGLVFDRGRNHPEGFSRPLLMKAGEGITGRAYAERRPAWTNDRLADPSLAYAAANAEAMQRADAPRAYLAVPIMIRDEVFGVLGGSYFEPHAFTEREVNLLSSLAAQGAVAIENARLYSATQQNLAGAALLNAAARTLHRTLDVKRLLPEAAGTLGQTFGASRVGIVLFEEPGSGSGDVIAWGDWPPEAGRGLPEPLPRLAEAVGQAVEWDAAGGPALAAALERTGESADGDLELAGPERRTLRWMITPTRDLLGGEVGVTVTLRDVTREREIDRMKTEFVSTVSHELRTPLASIKGSLHLLLSDEQLVLDETQRRLVDISLKNTDRLIRLINNILDISKMEAGHIHLDLEMHQPVDFVELAVDGIRGFAESRRSSIETQLETDLPSVRVDFDRMVQVVTNLLSNAIKFSPEQERVTVGARRTGADLEIWVSDHGRGIAPEDVGRLFRKFQQLDGSNVRAVGGTGLGLAICRGIVEEHGGRIEVDSRPGAGATFTVRLPVPGAAAAAPRTEAPAQRKEQEPPVLG